MLSVPTISRNSRLFVGVPLKGESVLKRLANVHERSVAARTSQLRLELGDEVSIYDEYVRAELRTVALAKQILDARGITPPSLE